MHFQEMRSFFCFSKTFFTDLSSEHMLCCCIFLNIVYLQLYQLQNFKIKDIEKNSQKKINWVITNIKS